MKPPISRCPAEDTPFFLAGHLAPAGTYRMLDTEREVRLDWEDTLPASCDGHIAVYRRMPSAWSDLKNGVEDLPETRQD